MITTTTSRDELTRAARLHRAGNLEQAADLYESVLKQDRAHADALHLLGVVRHQQTRHQEAAELIGRALALRPKVAVYHATLAEIRRALGEHEQAVKSGCEAIRLGADDPAARLNMGLSLHLLGRHAEAAGAFLGVLEACPGDALAHTNLGAALRILGEQTKALDHMAQAVRLDPRLAPARNNLGQYLLELGRPGDALAHCHAALALEPERPEAHNNLGNVYRALGHHAEARWCYGEALRLDPTMAQAAVNLALVLQIERRWDDALDWLRRATEIAPDSLDYLALLAESAVDREYFDEAIACYQKIVDREPDDAMAHNALGWLLQEEGRLDDSERHLLTAQRLRPDLSAVQLNLGGLHEKRGDFAAAEACFRSAADDSRTRGHALARLAMLLRGKLSEVDYNKIEKALEDTDESHPSQSHLLFALANVDDARHRFKQAAAHASRANSLALARLQKRGLVHDPAQHEGFVGRLIETFDVRFFERLSGTGIDTKRPVFIVGLPRSGTTLVEQILASHSGYYGAGELPLARRDFEAIPRLMGREDAPVACMADLDASVIGRLAREHDEQLRRLDGGQFARIGDKMPDNYIHLGLLATLFPNAVFIHCRRDLRDVAVSCWLTPFQSVYWTNDVGQIAARIGQHERLMNHWHSVLPRPIHEIHYEQVVDDLEGTARRLVDACGLEWEPNCLDFHRTQRPVRTASFQQVRQPVYRGSIGRWKNYETELAELLTVLPS